MKNLRWFLSLFVLLAFSLQACGEVPANEQGKSSTSKKDLLVYVSGLGSSLSADGIKQNNGFGFDPAWTNIDEYLKGKDEFRNAQVMTYSYRGFNDKGDVKEYPCEDTFNDLLKYNVGLLNLQITQYLKQHIGTDVYIITHSLGGVIAFGMLAQLVETTHANQFIDLGKSIGTLKGLATLDSPLGGVVNDALYDKSIVAKSAFCKIAPQLMTFQTIHELQQLFQKATSPMNQGETASILDVLDGGNIPNQKVAEDAANAGVRILIVGNENDLLWKPEVCNLGADFISTQYLKEIGDVKNGKGGRLYSRSFTSGEYSCPELVNNAANHVDALKVGSIGIAIWQTFTNRTVDQLVSVPVQPTPSPTSAPVQNSLLKVGDTWYGQIVPGTVTPEGNPVYTRIILTVTSVDQDAFSGTMIAPMYNIPANVTGYFAPGLSGFNQLAQSRLKKAVVRDDTQSILGYVVIKVLTPTKGITVGSYNLKYVSGATFEHELQGNIYYPDNLGTTFDETFGTDKSRFKY